MSGGLLLDRCAYRQSAKIYRNDGISPSENPLQQMMISKSKSGEGVLETCVLLSRREYSVSRSSVSSLDSLRVWASSRYRSHKIEEINQCKIGLQRLGVL